MCERGKIWDRLILWGTLTEMEEREGAGGGNRRGIVFCPKKRVIVKCSYSSVPCMAHTVERGHNIFHWNLRADFLPIIPFESVSIKRPPVTFVSQY